MTLEANFSLTSKLADCLLDILLFKESEQEIAEEVAAFNLKNGTSFTYNHSPSALAVSVSDGFNMWFLRPDDFELLAAEKD